VDPSLGLGFGHSLHPVRPGFELEPRIDFAPGNAGDDFLEAAVLAGALADDLDLPARAIRETRIHAEQIAGKYRRFVTPGAGADFEKHIARIARITWQKQLLQLEFERIATRRGVLYLFLGQLPDLRVRIARHESGFADSAKQREIFGMRGNHRADLGILAAVGTKAVLIPDHARIAEQCRELLVSLAELREFVEQGFLYHGSSSPGAAPCSRPSRRRLQSSSSVRPSAAALRNSTLGPCNSLLVRPRASCSST